MRGYGKIRHVSGSSPWKTDYHCHRKDRKVGNWWEDMSENPVPRCTMNREWRKEEEEAILASYSF